MMIKYGGIESIINELSGKYGVKVQEKSLKEGETGQITLSTEAAAQGEGIRDS
jgi:hypothetical protein